MMCRWMPKPPLGDDSFICGLVLLCPRSLHVTFWACVQDGSRALDLTSLNFVVWHFQVAGLVADS
jgi:hypothetical protein